MAKAARGELRVRLPVGLAYDQLGNVTPDPDAGVRAAIEYLFRCFEQTGSAHAVVKQFATEQLRFPGRHAPGGPHAGETYWKPLRHDLVLFTLHNPRYAGAYFYGRRKQLTDINGHTRTVLKPRDQWTVLIRDAHPGYITFEQYEQNQQTLAANAAAHSHEERRAGPAREGPALLQGLVVCGKCGKRMTVSYHKRCNGEPQPDYHCSRERDRDRHPAVPDDLRRRRRCRGRNARARTAHPAGDRNRARRLGRARPAADADQIRQMGVQRAEHAAEAARRRYLAVDPTNRLVADQLEADWNNKLRELADAKDEYERATQAGNRPLTHEQHARIRALATDLPALWANPATPMRERKRLIRLLLTDVTLNNTGEQITAHVRLSGGQQHTLHAPRPLPAWEAHTTPPTTISLIDQLLDDHTYDQTVEILNSNRLTGGWGKPFTVVSLTQLCRNRSIPSHQQRLKAAGMLTLEETADQLGVSTQTIKIWQRRGHITGQRIDGRRAHLYHPGQNRPSDGRRRPPPAGSAAAARHHHPSTVTDGIPTTTTPGGAV